MGRKKIAKQASCGQQADSGRKIDFPSAYCLLACLLVGWLVRNSVTVWERLLDRYRFGIDFGKGDIAVTTGRADQWKLVCEQGVTVGLH